MDEASILPENSVISVDCMSICINQSNNITSKQTLEISKGPTDCINPRLPSCSNWTYSHEQKIDIVPYCGLKNLCYLDNNIGLRFYDGNYSVGVEFTEFPKIYHDYSFYIKLIAELLTKMYLSHDRRLSWKSTIDRIKRHTHNWRENFTRLSVRTEIYNHFIK